MYQAVRLYPLLKGRLSAKDELEALKKWCWSYNPKPVHISGEAYQAEKFKNK